MGWIISKGIGVPFRMGSGQSWQTYWSQQTEVLFFGLYSEIAGGQMPNKVTGATDYLTVAGAVGSETYQCPNTAAYIAADTDYIWVKTDGTTWRTTTTAELIGYDFTRTIVKYADTAPYAIEAIMILSSDVDTNKMRDDFHLSVWWDNTLSDYGNIKQNRVSGQSTWTAERSFIDVIADGNTVAWYNYLNSSTITKDGSNRVSRWNDGLGSGRDLLQATGSKQPTWTSDGILFGGVDEFMKCDPFAFIQPEFIYLVVKQITFSNGDRFFEGNADSLGFLEQVTPTPNIRAYAGQHSGANSNLALDTWGIVRVLFNGLSSKLIVNETTPVTGQFGTQNMGGFTLGARDTGHWANIQVKGVVLRKVADNPTDEAIIYNYLKSLYSLYSL